MHYVGKEEFDDVDIEQVVAWADGNERGLCRTRNRAVLSALEWLREEGRRGKKRVLRQGGRIVSERKDRKEKEEGDGQSEAESEGEGEGENEGESERESEWESEQENEGDEFHYLIRSYLGLDKGGRELVRSKGLIQDLTNALRISGQNEEHWLFLTALASKYEASDTTWTVEACCDACGLNRRLTKRIRAQLGSHQLDLRMGCVCFAKINICRRMHEWWANNLLSVQGDAVGAWRSLYYGEYMNLFEDERA